MPSLPEWFDAYCRSRERMLRSASIVGYVVASCVFVAAILTGVIGTGFDAAAYWSAASGNPYLVEYTVKGTYVYSPPTAQLLSLFAWMGPHGLAAAIAAVSLASLLYVAGPWATLLLFVPDVQIELLMGNINLLVGAAVVMGFRRPWAWTLVLLTKVTPGVALLWFGFRRQWRALAVAILPTILISLASLAVAPELWRAWLHLLLNAGASGAPPMSIPIPLLPRLIAAAALVVWGARTGRPQTVVVSVWLALPALWGQTTALLAASIPLVAGPPEWLTRRATAPRLAPLE